MHRSNSTLRTVVAVLVALVVNVVLDLALDLPMLVRWGIALTAVLALVVLLEALRRRAAAQRPENSRT